jgi:hypothetical protein
MGLFEKITNENFEFYAARNYENPTCLSIKEFKQDISRFIYINKLFSRYFSNNELKERLILNHIIILYNVFENKSVIRLLFFKTEKKYWSALKAFLLFLNKIPEKQNIHLKKDINEIDYHLIETDYYIFKRLTEEL